MYKIIIPFQTQGFLHDAEILHDGFKNSKIFMSSNNIPYSDINIFIDRINKIELMYTAKINILSANHELLLNEQHYENQIPKIKKLDYVFAKTRYGLKIIKLLKEKYDLKFTIYYIGHTTIFPHKNIHKRDYTTILHLAGAHHFKNTDTIIKCWMKYDNLPPIIIGCYDMCIKNSLMKYLTKEEYDKIKENKKITFINSNMNFNDVVTMKYYYAIHLCPSMTEGYGHYINEGRITKSLVITSNFPPMNELIDDKSGILMNCESLYTRSNGSELCIFDIDTVANTIFDVQKLSIDQINKFGENAYEKYIADTADFYKNAKIIDRILTKS